MTRKKLLLGLVLLPIFLLLIAGARLWNLQRSGLPIRDGAHVVAGLSADVSVRFDAFGVPHIEAQNAEDGLAALGWAHANDRMTQLELGRRAAFGRLSEILGEPGYEIDVHFRRLQLADAAETLLQSSSAPSRAFLDAYAQGVNAWLTERGDDLPPALRLLGVEPEPWRPVDSLAFALMMANELSFWDRRPEEERFTWLKTFGVDGLRDLLSAPDLVVSPALAEAAQVEIPSSPDADSEVEIDSDAESDGTVAPGSNNWTVGGSRTASGKPLLAGDPHLALRLPSFWYQALIRSPEYEAAGMTLPGTPGVTIGRGRQIGWSFTNVMLDDHDLVFETIDEEGRYQRGPDDWRPLEIREEKIRLRGGEERTIIVRSTDLGPLLEADEDLGLPPRSLLWTAHQGGDPIAALRGVALSSTAEEAIDAAANFTVPAQNLVAALPDGTLLHTMLGRVPARRGDADGRLPTIGAGGDVVGWDGLRSSELDPRNLRPVEDFIVTANHDFLLDRPEDAPYEHPLTTNVDTTHRADRIRELLLTREDWDAEGFAALQTDTISLYARDVLATFLEESFDAEADRAAELLRAWDGDMAGAGAPALYELLQRQLQNRIFGDEIEKHEMRRFSDRRKLLDALRGEMRLPWFDDVSTEPVETRSQILAEALAASWNEAVARWGDDPANWNYEQLHRLTLEHPLDAVPLYGDWARRGPYPLPGSSSTVNAMGARWTDADELDVTYGPSMRWIVDWGDGKTYAVLPGGQSGHPGDRHYDDQMPLYLRGEMRDAAWTKEEIEAATVSTLILTP